MKPLLLDLFCGAGGAAMGYHRAGFDVVGVDHNYQPHYPFEFIRGDALMVLANTMNEWPLGERAIHASPPCQAYTKAQKLMANDHPDLLGGVRHLCELTGLPYVIENVPGAPLRNPVVIEGQMFPELNVHRPRLFETNWPLEVPALIPPPPRQTKMGRKPIPGEAIHVVGHFSGIKEAREAMGIDWMNQAELAEAIPPAYTEFIGKQLLNHISTKEAA